MTGIATSTSRFTSIMPGLAVADLDRAVAFYTERLGFEVAFTNGDPVVFALLDRDGVRLTLNTFSPPAVGPGAVYLKLEGVDALYELLTAAGVEMIHPLQDEPYGMRECMFRDPDGNTINLGQPL